MATSKPSAGWVQARNGRWYVRQVLPYRTRDHRTEGVVIRLSDASGTIGRRIGRGPRAGSIVEHLRGFIEKGRPQFESTDLREIVRNVPRLLGREIQQEHVTLQLDLHPRPLPIYADRIQIEQVIVNLIQNAIDALGEAPSDRREIELHFRAALESDGRARAATTERAAVAARLARLTPREREVLELLVAGQTSKEIAAALQVSVRTVEGHRRRVFSKMVVSSAAQLVGTVLSARDARPRP